MTSFETWAVVYFFISIVYSIAFIFSYNNFKNSSNFHENFCIGATSAGSIASFLCGLLFLWLS